MNSLPIGGGGGGQTSSAQSTAQTIFGGGISSKNLQTSLPWIIGGVAILAIMIGAVIISAGRK